MYRPFMLATLTYNNCNWESGFSSNSFLIIISQIHFPYNMGIELSEFVKLVMPQIPWPLPFSYIPSLPSTRYWPSFPEKQNKYLGVFNKIDICVVLATSCFEDTTPLATWQPRNILLLWCIISFIFTRYAVSGNDCIGNFFR